MKIYLLLQKLFLALTLARCVELDRQCSYLTEEEVGQSSRCCELVPAISCIFDCLAYKQDGQSSSQSPEIILKSSVVSISDKLDLLRNQSRESVITKTPTGSPSFLSPSNSLEQLQAQNLDRENCNSFGIQPIDTQSDLDSDISSINGDPYPSCDHTIEFPIVGTPIRRSSQSVFHSPQSRSNLANMDEKEVEIELKLQKLQDKMDLFPVENVQIHVLPLVDSEIKQIKQLPISFEGVT